MSLLPELLGGLRDIVIVAFLGYGLRFMKQRNELLEQEKALKQTEIEIHKASIEHLKSVQAPAIARDLEQMTRTANEYAEQKQKLENRLSELTRENNVKVKAELDEANFLGIAMGSLEAQGLLIETRRQVAVIAGLSGLSIDEDLFLKPFNHGIKHMRDIAIHALSDRKPELPNLQRLLNQIRESNKTVKSQEEQHRKRET